MKKLTGMKISGKIEKPWLALVEVIRENLSEGYLSNKVVAGKGAEKIICI